MAYFFKENQDYIVKGTLLATLQDLIEIYKTYPLLKLKENNNFETIPVPKEKRDYFVGILANELQHTIERLETKIEATKGVV